MKNKPRDREQSATKISGRKVDHPPTKASSAKDTFPTAQESTTEPDTPAPPTLDLQSPSSCEQSAARPDSRDTPPPPDLDVDASAVIGRATRRPRGSVSYAEPNLRDKMRRPSKTLVDAVGADDRPQAIKVEEAKRSGTSTEEGQLRTVVVKREEMGEETNSLWKRLPLPDDNDRQGTTARSEPASPLGIKSPSVRQLPASLVPEIRHGGNGISAKDTVRPSSASASTIAALVAGSQKGRRRENAEPQERAGGSKDLFDLHTSSPIDHVVNGDSVPTARSSRRHSSMANGLGLRISSVAAAESTTRRGDRRKEGTSSSRGKGGEQARGENELKVAKGVSGLQPSAVQMNMSRTERSASRRRSMML